MKHDKADHLNKFTPTSPSQLNIRLGSCVNVPCVVDVRNHSVIFAVITHSAWIEMDTLAFAKFPLHKNHAAYALTSIHSFVIGREPFTGLLVT